MSPESNLRNQSANGAPPGNASSSIPGSTSGGLNGANRSVSPLAACVVVGLATLLGSGSLGAFFGFFLVGGPLELVNLRLGETATLAFNTLLCFVFFLQHSGMVRRSYRRWSSRFIPWHYQGAFYAITSSVALLTLVVFWQESSHALISLEGSARWSLRVAYCLAILGFVWGIRSLGSFDGLGLKPILDRLRSGQSSPIPFTVRGPYRWVRHPLYLFCLFMIWSCPDVTADRLLFNVLFTAWIIVGAILEERDLVADFGDTYRDYQRAVPMLFPRRLWPLPSSHTHGQYRSSVSTSRDGNSGGTGGSTDAESDEKCQSSRC